MNPNGHWDIGNDHGTVSNGNRDDWMRLPETRKNRVCIRPEISRTYTFGRSGVSGGQFFDRYLKSILLNKVPVDWSKIDLMKYTKVRDFFGELIKIGKF